MDNQMLQNYRKDIARNKKIRDDVNYSTEERDFANRAINVAADHIRRMQDECEDCGCKLNGSGAETRTGFVCEECFEEIVEL